MKHAILGKIVIVTLIFLIIGTVGTAILGFHLKFISWDLATSQEKEITNNFDKSASIEVISLTDSSIITTTTNNK
ncbi:hypothetical protein [Sporosarcina limicola]|uniref:Uncharacterized protein n=1 Tax=Sporosarcina limicola TaxID=34101 RepID=A0A927MLK6_9BACL|nr:hypothetical protein [Sporosarcina limicola]MBE1556954.1 hypothetical protein [Sporosarcina limicola]